MSFIENFTIGHLPTSCLTGNRFEEFKESPYKSTTASTITNRKRANAKAFSYLLSELQYEDKKKFPKLHQNYNCCGVICVLIIFIFRRRNEQTYTTTKRTFIQQFEHRITLKQAQAIP